MFAINMGIILVWTVAQFGFGTYFSILRMIHNVNSTIPSSLDCRATPFSLFANLTHILKVFPMDIADSSPHNSDGGLSHLQRLECGHHAISASLPSPLLLLGAILPIQGKVSWVDGQYHCLGMLLRCSQI